MLGTRLKNEGIPPLCHYSIGVDLSHMHAPRWAHHESLADCLLDRDPERERDRGRPTHEPLIKRLFIFIELL